jgi:hypothetical protein
VPPAVFQMRRRRRCRQDPRRLDATAGSGSFAYLTSDSSFEIIEAGCKRFVVVIGVLAYIQLSTTFREADNELVVRSKQFHTGVQSFFPASIHSLSHLVGDELFVFWRKVYGHDSNVTGLVSAVN